MVINNDISQGRVWKSRTMTVAGATGTVCSPVVFLSATKMGYNGLFNFKGFGHYARNEEAKAGDQNAADRVDERFAALANLIANLTLDTELYCIYNVYLHKVKECECLAQKLSKQTESVNKEVHNNLLKSFSKLEKHSISLELSLQHCKEQMKNNPVCKENASNVFRKEREQYHEIQDLKAQMQDKNIAISELKKLIENCKGKSVETQFNKPSVVRQPNAQRIPKPSVLGKPTPFSNSPEMRSFQTKQSVNKTNVSDGLFKQVTQQNLPQIRKQAVRNTNVIAPGPSRNCPKHVSHQSPREKVGSNDMVHNYYLEKAKKSAQLQKDKEVNGKPSMIDPARLPNTANGCKPKPRNWQASMSSRVSNKDVHLGEHRKQKPFLKFNDLQCPTCKKCLYSANHDECVLEYLSKLNPRASAQIKDAKSHNTTKRYVPVEKTSESKKPERLIPKGHRFSHKKTTTVPEKTRTPRSCLRWQPTGRILKTVCLRWVPTGKLLNSCTSKVESEPTHGSNVDIYHIHACKQTLGLSAADQASVFMAMMSVHISSGLVLHQMTSDHNRSELGIQDHSNEQSSSKLVPKVFPAVKGWLDEDLDNYHLKELRCSTQCHTQMSMWIISRGVVLLILLMEYKFQVGYNGFTSHVITTIADRIRDKDTSQSKQNLQSSSMTFIHKTLIIPSVLDSCFISSTVSEVKSHKVVRLGINPMIQPEPEDLPKDNPKLEIAVLRYYNNGMFMLNLNKVPSSINSVYMAYSHVVDSKLWHARLGHVHYQCLHDMSKDSLIPSFDKNMETFWGCRAVIRLPEPKKKILGEKGIDCIFIGYAEHSKAYRFYVIEPNDFVSINSLIESRDAIFDENRFSSIPRPKDIVSSSNGTQGGDPPGETPIEIPEPRRSNRARVAKSYGSDFQLYLVEGSRDEIASQYSYCYSIEEDRKTFDKAMKSRDVAFWKEAVDDEI
ncbi:zinc finger, CCHC-type containing protein [Tanacetum coccineum]|uniref:Zinc finger, CCHC-type containing protein n=1 Tax=Tanacetum coccineum TaxID=301880 RepID=A0ABQ4WTY4_9ASTR